MTKANVLRLRNIYSLLLPALYKLPPGHELLTVVIVRVANIFVAYKQRSNYLFNTIWIAE